MIEPVILFTTTHQKQLINQIRKAIENNMPVSMVVTNKKTWFNLEKECIKAREKQEEPKWPTKKPPLLIAMPKKKNTGQGANGYPALIIKEIPVVYITGKNIIADRISS